MISTLDLLKDIHSKLCTIEIGVKKLDKQDICSGGVVPDTQRVNNVRK